MEEFMSVSDVQEEEINQLTKLFDERREAGVKGAYPAKLRGRIVRLWRSGVPTKVLSERLGISESMLYGWGKKETEVASTQEAAADVLEVDPGTVAPGLSTAGELRLQLGKFAVTVSLVGA
jgi:hypothetical protein